MSATTEIDGGTFRVVSITGGRQADITIDGLAVSHVTRNIDVRLHAGEPPQIRLELAHLRPSLDMCAALKIDISTLLTEGVAARLSLLLGSRPGAGVLGRFRAGQIDWQEMDRELRALLRDGSWINDLPK
jgi:hypothetical protein